MLRVVVAVSLWFFCSAATFAQEPFNLAVQVDKLSSIFTQLYGRDGLIVDSLAALPSGDTHRLISTARFRPSSSSTARPLRVSWCRCRFRPS